MNAPAYVLGHRVDNASLNEVIKNISQEQSKKKLIILPFNVHILTLLLKNERLKKIHDKASIIFADGVPLIHLSKLTSTPIYARVSGTDLVEEVFKLKMRTYLIGPRPSIVKKLKKKYPDTVVGSYFPPFDNHWYLKDNLNLIKNINDSHARVVLVGVTSPKQEIWLDHFLIKTDALVGMAVGSAFEILSGIRPRAPKMMKDYGLEWVWRVYLEPKRLLRRYFIDFIILLIMSVKYFIQVFNKNLKN